MKMNGIIWNLASAYLWTLCQTYFLFVALISMCCAIRSPTCESSWAVEWEQTTKPFHRRYVTGFVYTWVLIITLTLAFSHFLCFALSKNPAKHFPHIPLTSLFWFLVLLARHETSKTACSFVFPSSVPPNFLPVFCPDISHSRRPHLRGFPSVVSFAITALFLLPTCFLLLFPTLLTFLSEKIVVPYYFPPLVRVIVPVDEVLSDQPPGLLHHSSRHGLLQENSCPSFVVFHDKSRCLCSYTWKFWIC